jgi:Holliday junction resolvase RusA-like endonuclease
MTQRISQKEFKEVYASDLGKLQQRLSLQPNPQKSLLDAAETPKRVLSSTAKAKHIIKSGESASFSMILPFPPSVNKLFPTGKDGRRHLSKEGQDFKKEAQIAMVKQNAPYFEGSLSITLKLYRPRKSGDIDNFNKGLFDSMKGICFEDDKQIVELHIYRLDDKQCPRVEIEMVQKGE